MLGILVFLSERTEAHSFPVLSSSKPQARDGSPTPAPRPTVHPIPKWDPPPPGKSKPQLQPEPQNKKEHPTPSFPSPRIRSHEMKRPIDARDPTPDDDPTHAKKRKQCEEEEELEAEAGFAHLDENLLFEVLKHVDARTLATAACVSKQWHKTAQDERLWEMICTRHWPNTGCGNQQLRSVVLALGGFRNLHAFFLWPLLKPQTSSQPSAPSSSSSTAPGSSRVGGGLPVAFPVISGKAPAPWGKDEVHLSLSLLSIRFYEKMNPIKRGR